MTQDEIIEMAMKAEFVSHGNPSCEESELFVCTDKDIVHFAKLIAKAEREACANLVEGLPAPDEYSDTDKSMWDVTCIDCADAIRARGQA